MTTLRSSENRKASSPRRQPYRRHVHHLPRPPPPASPPGAVQLPPRGPSPDAHTSNEQGATVSSQCLRFQHVNAESQPGPRRHKARGSETSALTLPVKVTVTEVPSPLSSPTEAPAAVEGVFEPPEQGAKTDQCAFPYFPLLPAELRLKIWHMSFLPRTVVLHTRRSHYADYVVYAGAPRWQSESWNPAALSVNTEARAAALEFYTVAMPLFAPPPQTPTPERPGDLQDSDRVLYLNLEQDTVVLLGDLHYTRLMKLLGYFRNMDIPRGRSSPGAASARGLKRLAMSVALWTHEVGAATLKAFARSVFADIEEFILFTYSEPLPPGDWRGACVLEEAAVDTDYYRHFIMGRGRQFRVDDGWMVVGRGPIKMAEINFIGGWG